MWSPDRYLRYAGERGRPFVELVARVAAASPRRVVDLGCGPGNLTALLTERWPEAEVIGVDDSPEMIARAAEGGGSIEWRRQDLRDWNEDADVIVTNAALQWVPGHLELLPGLAGHTEWLALQVPGNFEEPSHTIRAELEDEYGLEGLARPSAPDAATYLDALPGEVDAWETTYLHVLEGEDAVFDWISGTSLRPALAALDALDGEDGTRRLAFEEELKRRLRQAYPARGGRVVLPFRRVFAVAHRR